MSVDTNNPALCRRRALKVVVCGLCSEVGFASAEDGAVETLVEMLQSYISELGRSAHSYSELSGRTQSMLSDVVMASVEMGQGGNISSLPAYARRPNRCTVKPPSASLPSATHRALQAGAKKQHPGHIPEHLPPFPDPHTYIRTQMHKEPTTEYELIREQAASQKRDVERALTRFIAKTGETESLFMDDPYAFPLIAAKSKHLAYLEALMPKDHEMETQEEEDAQKKQSALEKDDKDEKPSLVKEEEAAPNTTASQDATAGNGQEVAAQAGGEQGQIPGGGAPGTSTAPATTGPTGPMDLDNDNKIDNPYLRAIKMPKLKGGGKKHNLHKW